ncbi:MAG: BrnT family toxin [Aquamicrobium sp.]|uniref:BrnT family toxin n=1 Tax=Aquamicrobium sp. TaxID=1872579 RepID=UPI00349E6145|nr:BrnT family toxin [Aquamicrobium sp.]
MEIEFDPAKDATNIAKHGMSLQAAEAFDWDTAFEREDDRFDYGEVRFVAMGLIDNRLHVLVFTEGSHENAVRAISLRLAEKHEARFYHGQV